MSNGDGEIQPVIEPAESTPPMSKADAKTEKELKVKVEKKCKSDAKAAIGNPWNTGVFSCHEDRTNAEVTAFLPCITFGQIAEVLDEGKLASPWGSFFYLLMMPVVCTQWIMGSKYRKNLRKKYDLVEAPYTDKVSHIFCACCSLCQEYRELKVRGLNPSLGWRGILAQKNEKQTREKRQDTPPENQEMIK
ncbi:hypothetical protein RND81_09G114900 [Saponaria officinalis]|uniref:Protein PLANT CADMIUM RESISTANCE 8 n=1 Tax=Saponaria officinalis TaxID=3572 RepID=A0AAW1ILK0_SAPOF